LLNHFTEPVNLSEDILLLILYYAEWLYIFFVKL
jgi:hypothetical protein